MLTTEIQHLLQKSLDPLPLMVGNRSLHSDIDDLVAMVFPRAKLAVVQDYHTGRALGGRVFSALKGQFEPTLITLEDFPHAGMGTVETIRAQASGCDALVAVGSGTINDLCKYAAHLDNKPYIVFPTAASMNGYLSANASITVDGYKKTLAATMPKAVFCDLSVIAAAPVRLNKSGLGDSLARPTAQFDWLLSHLLLGTPYNELPFELLAPLETALFENARGIMMGDLPSLELLVQTLLLSGLGMTIAGGSYPASQSEHMVAHAMHMLNSIDLPDTFHGEEIGVTTLITVRMQERLLKSTPHLRMDDFPAAEIELLFGEHVMTEAKEAYAIKHKLDSRLRGNDKIKNWDAIAEKLEKVMIPSSKLEAILEAADAPITPEALGWPAAPYNMALTHARFLRDRFTVLDLA